MHGQHGKLDTFIRKLSNACTGRSSISPRPWNPRSSRPVDCPRNPRPGHGVPTGAGQDPRRCQARPGKPLAGRGPSRESPTPRHPGGGGASVAHRGQLRV